MGGIQLPIGLPTDGEDLSWQSESRCAKPDVDPEWWFAQDRKLKGPALKTAFALCVTCPVLDQCKRWTLKTDKELPSEMIHGIQGGLRRQERLAAKRGKDTQCDDRCVHCSKRLRPRHVLEEDSPGTVEMGDPNHCIPCLTVELSKEYPYCGNTPGVEARYMFSGAFPSRFWDLYRGGNPHSREQDDAGKHAKPRRKGKETERRTHCPSVGQGSSEGSNAR